MSSWPKCVRDPIHNLIVLEDNSLNRLIAQLIDCAEFQRLRRIKQLGFSDMTFPGATHTRFAHSLGVMWNCKKFLDRVRQLDSSLVNDEQVCVITVAALLHDIGHGPFSHAFEKVTEVRHEKQTVEIILNPDTEVHKALSRYGECSDLALRVAKLFPEGAGLLPESAQAIGAMPKHLLHIISSQFDADRADYLLRDSHFSGTEYGRFDLRWLLDHLEIDTEHGRLVFSRKAHHAAEEYVFARYHMYQAVYFHKATRAAEVMLKSLFKRYKEIVKGATSSSAKLLDIPKPLQKAFDGTAGLADFLSLDDHTVTEFLKAARNSSDKTISYLAVGLLNRRFLKAFDATDLGRGHPDKLGDFRVKVQTALSELKSSLPIDPEYWFLSDSPSDTPYKIYDPDSENPAAQLYVRLGTNEIKELSQVSDMVNALRKKVTMLRYYFPESARSTVDSIATSLLKEAA